MTVQDIDKYEAFAKAYADPTSPGYNNAKKTYKYLHPEVTDDSAKKLGSKFLKDPRVQAHVVEYRQRMRIVAGKTHEEYLAFGWKLMERMADAVIDDPKLASGLAKVFETVGKAGGFLITKVEDMTPLERKIPLSPDEAITRLEERLLRAKRMNEPNPLPQITAAPAPVPAEAEEVEYETLPTHPAPDDSRSIEDAPAAGGPLHEG